MTRILLILICLVSVFATTGRAQDILGRGEAGAPRVWVQIEAKPSLLDARNAARRYAATLPEVGGFTLGNGWYAIALGPYSREEGERVARLSPRGADPRDSYIARRSAYERQFWPVGASLDDRTADDAPMRRQLRRAGPVPPGRNRPRGPHQRRPPEREDAVRTAKGPDLGRGL